MSTDWTPFDFILNGEFADAQHLRKLLACIREAAKAECVLLLVYQHPDFFQSLLYVSHADRHCETELQNALAKAELSDDDRQALRNLLIKPAKDVLPELLGRQLKYRVFRKLCERFKSNMGHVVLTTRRPRACVVPPNVPPVIGVLCIEPKVEAGKQLGHGTKAVENALSEEPPPSDELTDLLNELALVVNTTAPVYLRRLHLKQLHQRTKLHMAKREIEKAFSQKESNSPPLETVRPPLSPFLKTVLDETGSTRGGIFMVQETPKKLEALLRLHRTGSQYEESPGEPIRVDRRVGLVSRVFRKAQPFLFNDREDFKQMNRRIEMIPFPGEGSPDANAALAVPIVVRQYESEHESVIGVLNIEKAGGTNRPLFSLADYSFVQDAADMLAGTWTPGWNELVEQIVRDTKQQFRPIPGRRSPTASFQDSVSRPPENLPGDFAVTRPHIQMLLRHLCRAAVPVSACTVRVMSIDQTQLVLLAEHWPQALGLRIPAVRDLHGSSPMARVMRRGRPVDGKASDLPTSQPELESYISFPLKMESRCVGVVTFASRFSEQFLTHHYPSLVDAAEAITEVFDWAQNQQLNPILHPSARVFSSIHELVKIPKSGNDHLNDLVKLLNGQRGFLSQEDRVGSVQNQLKLLRGDFDKLEECLQGYEAGRYTKAVDLSLASRPSIRELVEHVCKQEPDGILPILEAPAGSTPLTKNEDRIDPSIYEFCLDALRDLIRNAVQETSGAGFEKGYIRFHVRELGAQRYACITIGNPLKRPLNAKILPDLYRKSFRIKGSDRLRYGAFLAGWLIRSIGGDVHLTDLANKWFEVTVEIPLLPREPTG